MTKFDQILNELVNNLNTTNPTTPVQQTQTSAQPSTSNTTPQQTQQTNKPAQPSTSTQQKPLDIKALSQQLAKTTNPQEVEKILTPLLQVKQ